ncbi:hypothetical protein HPP92_010085 [Vanilla planifolia]|uniref:Uncharacterized protein n=1 Tax=Vanilla planifolia TaxID=51239 RepID=A0A835QY94_VANPL|nr:hypothetical protein HPP92_010280 [Vanilla planifolia]KAG0482001.1 hypothetical protein HPP92_010085 [Vanilla planifolia]
MEGQPVAPSFRRRSQLPVAGLAIHSATSTEKEASPGKCNFWVFWGIAEAAMAAVSEQLSTLPLRAALRTRGGGGIYRWRANAFLADLTI